MKASRGETAQKRIGKGVTQLSKCLLEWLISRNESDSRPLLLVHISNFWRLQSACGRSVAVHLVASRGRRCVANRLFASTRR